jgi:hypothetical protein
MSTAPTLRAELTVPQALRRDIPVAVRPACVDSTLGGCVGF